MNRLVAVAAGLVLILGCSRAEKSPVAIKIDGIAITADEFEQAYSSSYYAKEDSPSSRKAFHRREARCASKTSKRFTVFRAGMRASWLGRAALT